MIVLPGYQRDAAGSLIISGVRVARITDGDRIRAGPQVQAVGDAIHDWADVQRGGHSRTELARRLLGAGPRGDQDQD